MNGYPIMHIDIVPLRIRLYAFKVTFIRIGEVYCIIHKFADIASFAEIGIGGNLPATEEYREFIKKLHPTQFLTGRLTAPLYEVEYSYVTVRGKLPKGL